jgi:hypothetical protein
MSGPWRELVLRKGKHVYVIRYRTELELAHAVVSWVLRPELGFSAQDAVMLLALAHSRQGVLK